MRRRLDVAIVTYGNAKTIERCLASLRGLDGLGSVVVVDHGRDGSGDLARARGATVLEDPSNPGFASGQNRAIRAGSAEFVLLLNPDAVIVASHVDAAVTVLEGTPSAAAVQGVVLGPDGKPERSQGRELGVGHLWGRALGARALLRLRPVRALARRTSVFRDHVVRVPRQVTSTEALAATALLLRRSAFDAVGGFDEGFFLYGEDLDLCRRLRLAGYELLSVPWLFAIHENGHSSPSGWHRELHWWRGTMRFAAKWWSRPRFWLALSAATVRAGRLALSSPRSSSMAFREVVGAAVRERRALRSSAQSSTASPLRSRVGAPRS